MKKILCATDGTDHSAHAIELAAGLAAKFSASLSICAVNIAAWWNPWSANQRLGR